MSKVRRALCCAMFVAIATLCARSPGGAQQDANALPSPPATNNGAPPGPGRETFVNACSMCHSLTVITHVRWGKEAWRHQVYDMVQRGAQVSPAEMDTLVNYLVTNFGPGVPFPGQTPSHPNLIMAPGSDLVATRCTLCHSADRVTEAKRSPGQWNAIVAKMIFFGAPLTAPQVKTVVDYLNTHYGDRR